MNHENSERTYSGVNLKILMHDLLRMAARLWWLGAALVIVLGGLFCYREKKNYHPVYEAASTFTVYVSNPMQSEVRGYNAGTAEQMAKTFPYILTSGALQDMVMRDLGIQTLPMVSASVLNNTNIFTLSVKAADPQLAFDVLNSVIAHYPNVAEFVVGPTTMGLLDESGLPTEPVNHIDYPRAGRNGVLLGLGLWAAILLLLVMMRSTVHNEEELRQVINVRCVGSVPMMRRPRRGEEGCPLVDTESGRHGFTEAIRLLRVRVEKAMQEGDYKVLLVSSATPGEGKTTVAINLARALALKGKNTLLVDCDLRNPSVAKNLNMENTIGFADVLSGELDPARAINKTELETFSVVTAGAPVDNAAELLADNRSKRFLDACRERFDYVILDTPPSALLADASEIAVTADAAVMVIRQDYASRSQIIDGARLLADSGASLVGCVLNHTTRMAQNSYGGYYGYGYGYGRHYGYGESAKSE